MGKKFTVQGWEAPKSALPDSADGGLGRPCGRFGRCGPDVEIGTGQETGAELRPFYAVRRDTQTTGIPPHKPKIIAAWGHAAYNSGKRLSGDWENVIA